MSIHLVGEKGAGKGIEGRIYLHDGDTHKPKLDRRIAARRKMLAARCSADRTYVAGTWTYSRGGEKVEIHHVEHEDKAELVVQGLGPTSRREFNSLEAQLLYVTTLERNLVAAGWSLSHFRPERRGGQDRRTPRLGAPDWRRQGPVPLFPTKRTAAE